MSAFAVGAAHDAAGAALYDAREVGPDEAARLMNLAVSPASEPSRAAAWIEGFLRNSGEILYHDDALFGIFDGWLAGLSPEAIPALLPIFPLPGAEKIPKRRTSARSPSAYARDVGMKMPPPRRA